LIRNLPNHVAMLNFPLPSNAIQNADSQGEAARTCHVRPI
jgi:hypothetical protein